MRPCGIARSSVAIPKKFHEELDVLSGGLDL
jgi:hypothetical protein